MRIPKVGCGYFGGVRPGTSHASTGGPASRGANGSRETSIKKLDTVKRGELIIDQPSK